jgi:DNA segregation ATPase FtsK/SpoIIIE, S-DNA-T family
MARTRSAQRRRANGIRLNLEIVGIAAIALAVFCGFALVFPHYAGGIGAWTARELHWLFGSAAPFFPALVALIGGIVFLEINVPAMIAGLGTSALAYFLIFDAFLGAGGWSRGGAVGTNIWWALHSLVGGVGATILLAVAALSLTLWLTNASLKRSIGWLVLFLSKIKLPKLPQLPKPQYHYPVILSEADRAQRVEAESKDEQPRVTLSEASVASAVEGQSPPVVPSEARSAGSKDEPRVKKPVQRIVEPSGDRKYRLPDLSLFDAPANVAVDDSSRAHVLEDTLGSFGVGAKVVHIERGPSITRYELKPERGVKISRIASLADDLALALAATSVRIEAPIPGKSAIGIEVPNKTIAIVAVREILESLPNRGQVPPLWMALGKDITGRPVFGDLCKMPHLLVAGATGAGKSVCLNSIIASLLVSATPDQVQLLMIDPKRVELSVYNGIPHLIKDVIADPRLAAGALFEMTKEMDVRYERFAKAGVRKIEEYNAKFPDEHLPYVVIVIDELADLMLVAPSKVEATIMRLAQLARATGIHLVVATQRPSVDIITGLIKANVPSRIAFAVSSQTDSRVILDMNGA